MSSPSRYRRQGRNAFYRGGDPKTLDPYVGKHGLTGDLHSRDWLDGWREAEKHDELTKIQKAREAEDEEQKIEEFARLYLLAKERGLI
jgi:hypothetical protein